MSSAKPAHIRRLSSFRKEAASAIRGHWFKSLLTTLLLRILIVLAVAAVFNEPYSALESSEITLPVRIVRAPMDLFQYLTVLEPDARMLEVVVCAFNAALGEETNEVNAV